MRGIQYINDKNGNRTKAVIDLSRYGKEFALFVQELSKKYHSNENAPVQDNPFGNTNVGGDDIAYIGSNNANMPNTKVLKVDALIQKAKSLYGTPYRTGGTTASGMDCSGLTQTIFKSIGINLPRVSRDQAKTGSRIDFKGAKPGDLIFFATGTPNYINHVGVVSENDGGEIKFIHASSSRGVMESSMNIDYWRKAYMGLRRVV